MNKHDPDRQPPITEADLQNAIREADKGVFVSSEKVHDWMRQLETDPDAPLPEPDVFLNQDG